MSRNTLKAFRVWVLCCAALALVGSHVAAQQEFRATKRLGQAAVQFKDKATHVVAAYY